MCCNAEFRGFFVFEMLQSVLVASALGGVALLLWRRRHCGEARPRLLLVTNFEYVANGRDYAKEDLYLQAELRVRGFTVASVHPNDLTEADFAYSDHVLFRNTGTALTTHAASLDRWRRFQAAGADHGKLVNNLQLKGDVCSEGGKQHLLELTRLGGYPIIDAHLVGTFLDSACKADGELMIKPLRGADSMGLRRVSGGGELRNLAAADPEMLEQFVVQRLVSFDYEVSFYFVGECFAYALRTGGPGSRWEMAAYSHEQNAATWDADMAFAHCFVKWNGTSRGVVRVDGVRETSSGRLLLMEIEDYNPYLSLELLTPTARRDVVDLLARSIREERVGATT